MFSFLQNLSRAGLRPLVGFLCLAALVFPAVAGTRDAAPIIANATLKPDQRVAGPFIRNLPDSGPIKLVVLGDSLAEGLYIGLTRLNRGNKNLEIVKASRVNTGLVRSDRFDWNKRTKEIARSKEFQAAAVLLGLNDLQTFRTRPKRHHFKQKGWVKLYEERIETMIMDLKQADMAVYWVGIPITDPRRYQKEYAWLNEFFIRAAEKHGLRYVDTWKVIADEDGKYSPFWREASGKRRKIRLRDGIHFTTRGYEILAETLNAILQKDIDEVKGRRASR